MKKIIEMIKEKKYSDMTNYIPEIYILNVALEEIIGE